MADVSRWLLPVLVALLVLGHACELAAYAELVSHRGTAPHAPAPVEHADGDDHALTCDATVVTTAKSPSKAAPVLAVMSAAPGLASVVPPAPALPARTAKVATGPPLFLLLSSLLI
jgi:hypothetical protein